MCSFHDQMLGDKRFCSIDYGPEGESCSSYSQMSHSTSDVVMIGLPLQLSSTGRSYCFTVMGNNSTHTAVVEGTFVPGIKIVLQGNVIIINCIIFCIYIAIPICIVVSCSVSLGVSLTVVILLGAGVIAALTIVIVFLVQSKRKIQVQLLKAQTSNPTITDVPGLKSAKSCMYEEVGGDHANEILDVENIAYHKKDLSRRCATPCSDASGEDVAYYTTI